MKTKTKTEEAEENCIREKSIAAAGYSFVNMCNCVGLGHLYSFQIRCFSVHILAHQGSDIPFCALRSSIEHYVRLS